MKILVEMGFLLYDCRVFVEMELPKGMAASEIQHRKDLIEDRIVSGPGVHEQQRRVKVVCKAPEFKEVKHLKSDSQ